MVLRMLWSVGARSNKSFSTESSDDPSASSQADWTTSDDCSSSSAHSITASHCLLLQLLLPDAPQRRPLLRGQEPEVLHPVVQEVTRALQRGQLERGDAEAVHVLQETVQAALLFASLPQEVREEDGVYGHGQALVFHYLVVHTLAVLPPAVHVGDGHCEPGAARGNELAEALPGAPQRPLQLVEDIL
jgi:hypothetical protein